MPLPDSCHCLLPSELLFEISLEISLLIRRTLAHGSCRQPAVTGEPPSVCKQRRQQQAEEADDVSSRGSDVSGGGTVISIRAGQRTTMAARAAAAAAEASTGG